MQTLVVPLVVIVRRERAACPVQVPLTEEDDPVEAFFFDRTDEAFGVRVAIRRAVRRLYDTNPCPGQGLAERAAPLRVSVAEQDCSRRDFAGDLELVAGCPQPFTDKGRTLTRRHSLIAIR